MSARLGTFAQMFWEGKPVVEWEIVKVRVGSPENAIAWYSPFVGQIRQCIRFRPFASSEFICLDNEDGSAFCCLRKGGNRKLVPVREIRKPYKVTELIKNPRRWKQYLDMIANARIVKESDEYNRKHNPDIFNKTVEERLKKTAFKFN